MDTKQLISIIDAVRFFFFEIMYDISNILRYINLPLNIIMQMTEPL